MRYAVYFTPPNDHPLTLAAQRWLARDAFNDAIYEPQPFGTLTAADVAFNIAAARRYGFHATMVAPFELADGMTETDLVDALLSFCLRQVPFPVPLRIDTIGSFFALVPARSTDEVTALARDAVEHFFPYCAPLSDKELHRRMGTDLTMRQLSLLHRWGYPYVMEEFRFHMTLTGPVNECEQHDVRSALKSHFAQCIEAPVNIDTLSLFVEPEPGAAFRVLTSVPFRQVSTRKTA